MSGTIKSFNMVELYMIALFSLLMGCACTGICFILIGDPIFTDKDWIGIGVLISTYLIGIIVVIKSHK